MEEGEADHLKQVEEAVEAEALRKKVVALVVVEAEAQGKMLVEAVGEVVVLRLQAVVGRVSMRSEEEVGARVVLRLRLTLAHEVVEVEAFPLPLHSIPDKRSLSEGAAEALQSELAVVAVRKECAAPRRGAEH